MHLFNFIYINTYKEKKLLGPTANKNHFQNLITYKLYSTLKYCKKFRDSAYTTFVINIHIFVHVHNCHNESNMQSNHISYHKNLILLLLSLTTNRLGQAFI